MSITVLQAQGNLIEVKGELVEGEIVITHGNEGLADGALVELVAKPAKSVKSAKKEAGDSK